MVSHLLKQKNPKGHHDPLTVGHRPTLNNNLELLLR